MIYSNPTYLTPSHRKGPVAQATKAIEDAITRIAKEHDITDGELLRILTNEVQGLDMRNPRRKRKN